MTSEDIVQDVFVKLWSRNDHFKEEQPLKTWLYISVNNACLNHLKAKNPLVFSDEYDTVIKVDVSGELANWIGAITADKCRETLELIIDGYSLREIAARHNAAYHTVKNQRARGIYLIRKFLNRNLFS